MQQTDTVGSSSVAEDGQRYCLEQDHKQSSKLMTDDNPNEFDPEGKPCCECNYFIELNSHADGDCRFHWQFIQCFDGDIIRRPKVSRGGTCHQWEPNI